MVKYQGSSGDSVVSLDPSNVYDGSIKWSEYAAVVSVSEYTNVLNNYIRAFNSIDWNTYAGATTNDQQFFDLQSYALQNPITKFINIDWSAFVAVASAAQQTVALQSVALQNPITTFSKIDWSAFVAVATSTQQTVALQSAALQNPIIAFSNMEWSAFVSVTTRAQQSNALQNSLAAFINVSWIAFASTSTVAQQADALQNYITNFDSNTLPSFDAQSMIGRASAIDPSIQLALPIGVTTIAEVLYAAYSTPGCYALLPTNGSLTQSFDGSDAMIFLSALQATGKTTGTITLPIALAVPVNNVLPAPPATGSYFATVDKTVDATYTYVGSEDTLVVAGGVETFHSSIVGVNPVVLAKGAQYIFTPTSGPAVALTVNYAGGDLSTVGQPPPCFLYDAPVLTLSGYRAIGDLRAGDLVMSLGGPMVIKAIKKELAAPNDDSYPYVIPEGLYGATQRLLISPHHQVLVSPGVYKEARFLNLEREVMSAPWDYYNVELVDNTADMIVAGVVVETWKLWDGVERFP